MPIAKVSTINRYVFIVTVQKRSAEGAHTICWSSEMETPDDSVRAFRIEARLDVHTCLVSSNSKLHHKNGETRHRNLDEKRNTFRRTTMSSPFNKNLETSQEIAFQNSALQRKGHSYTTAS